MDNTIIECAGMHRPMRSFICVDNTASLKYVMTLIIYTVHMYYIRTYIVALEIEVKKYICEQSTLPTANFIKMYNGFELCMRMHP